MRIVVTGGAGYIGSICAAELLKTGHEVVVCDDMSKGHKKAVPMGVELIVCDTGDMESLDKLFKTKPVDAVFHFAGVIEVGESMRDPGRYFRINTANTLTLLEAMAANGVRKIVFSSSAAVYGEPEKTPIVESHLLRPTSVYGQSKLFVENMLDWYGRVHGIHYACLRYFNAAGGTEERGEAHNPETHLIPLVLRAAMDGNSAVSIFGTDYPTPDGTCLRDYVHVLDLVSAHLLAVKTLETNDKLIYNLGNGKGFSVREVVDVASKVTGRTIPVKEAPRRAGDPAILVASSEKIRRELGWEPQFKNLEDIIASAWKWELKKQVKTI